MAEYEITLKTGEQYLIDAESEDQLNTAIQELEDTAYGGGGYTNPSTGQNAQFNAAFDEVPNEVPGAADRPGLAAAMDERIHGDQVTGVFDRIVRMAQGEKQPEGVPYSGSILPFSKDALGNVSFDPDAGLLGVAKRAVTFPADAMRGKVDPLSDEGIARATEMAGVITPVSAGTRGGLGWAGTKPRTRAPVNSPTGRELWETGDKQFKTARTMDVRRDPAAVQDMAFKVRTELLKEGFKGGKQGNAKGAFDELKGFLKPAEPGAFATIDDLHIIRQRLNKVIENNSNPFTGKGSEVEAAGRVIAAIDEFIKSPDPASVVAGPAAAAADVWSQGMGNYAAGKRSDRLVDKPHSLEERTERSQHPLSTGSSDKITRDRVAALLNNPKTAAGFNKQEIALLEGVKNGTLPRNVVSLVGKLMGSNALAVTAGAAATGFAFGGIPGAMAAAAPGLVIGGSRALGNKLTRGALNRTAETVRKRSPLYEKRTANAPPVQQVAPSVRSVVPRAISGPALNPQQTQRYEEYLRQKWALEPGA